ncbi:EF-hand domain-containing protein [Actinomadura sp. DC4]|uniref:EF-hand domain-containing protein n=1 Tax=Actinomadura sp. DC4 TaxID=3055069 RepID=UPI0025B26616|nr:EF-hand domain-containing protein [Actinomadura sp. DC4]MDN3358839.1 EF-hand domain-containing protein [Actinomadura sp. DC4]
MAGEFQRRKIGLVFGAMDSDGDGFLEEADFAALTARWIAIRGDGDHKRLRTVMMGWWTTLLTASDRDRDGRVTLDEVLLVVDRLGGMPDAVTGTAEAMFEAVDEDGDGRVSAGEYHRLIEAWSGRPMDTDATFPLLDLDGDGFISRPEFVRLWTEFWAGDDPEASGTWVFGPLLAHRKAGS